VSDLPRPLGPVRAAVARLLAEALAAVHGERSRNATALHLMPPSLVTAAVSTAGELWIYLGREDPEDMLSGLQLRALNAAADVFHPSDDD
jgi:hypothetical protein